MSVYVSSEELTSASNELYQLKAEFENVFSQIKNRMNTVEGLWQSPAGSALQEKFAALSPSFVSCCTLIESFALYLSQTAEAYQENESMLSVS